MVDSLLIISSNVGSLFAEKVCLALCQPKEIIQSWKDTLKNQINNKKPSVVIITLQEFAGKQIVPWSESYRFLENLFDEFKTDYPRYLSTCDCDYETDKYFTALCTIFMVRDGFEPIEFFDFDLNEFQTIKPGLNVHELSYERQKSLKIKFGIELFPNNKWSRKGYMINRVRINGHVFDVVNLHLIHDLNFHALLETPKIYQNFRNLQLTEILKKLEQIESKKTILCGDFNFRTSILEIIKNYDPKCTIEREVKHRSTTSLLHFKGADENQVHFLPQSDNRLFKCNRHSSFRWTFAFR
ncbi:Type I inositol 1,4,5-trisphosphate 5-phosphatase [Thelohanellus kitauei]|uniref:Type I inositol 1,4,5-trisphosphate 5-phosphatase n=1 Tax=Thelohanellus kitauei TaxID=669202 RepID=A0A0C2MFU5_THEKT|nr:Type I inositol 1,4,5-trisphosphate 5-phosphatase [Thelohanellus kitauei]